MHPAATNMANQPATTHCGCGNHACAAESPRRQTNSALIIVLIVVATIMLGSALFVLLGFLWWSDNSRGNTTPRRAATVATMKMVESMLKTYNLDYGVYPPTLNDLIPKYAEKFPTDAWRRPLVYSLTPGKSHPFTLRSTGASGTSGDVDNIDYWTDVAH